MSLLVPSSNLEQVNFYPLLETMMKFFHWTVSHGKLAQQWKTSLATLQYPLSLSSEKLSDIAKLGWPPSHIWWRSLSCSKHVVMKRTEINRQESSAGLPALA